MPYIKGSLTIGSSWGARTTITLDETWATHATPKKIRLLLKQIRAAFRAAA